MKKIAKYLPTNDSTGFMIRSLHQSFNKVLARKISHAGLTTAQWFFLRALWENDGVAQRELSNSVGLTESTTVAALKIMEKNRLVKRKRDVKDSRRVIVRLTKKGKELEDKLLPDVLKINQIAHKGFSIRETKALQRQLRDIQVRLDKEANRSS